MKKYHNQINDEMWDTHVGCDLTFAVKLLSDDEVVAIPTETVYGLAGNAFSKKAIEKIYTIKNRPFNNPLIVHVSDVSKIKEIANDIPAIAWELLKKFSPGPLTVLLPKKATILDEITAGLKEVAIRIPNHQLTLELLQKLDFPLVAPSANLYGYISPTKPSHVLKQLGKKIPYILDGGSCDKGIESTVVGFENGKIVVYRLGAISLEMLAEVSNDIIVRDSEKEKPLSPGMVPHHYAPHTQLILTDNPEDAIKHYNINEVAFIGFKNKIEFIPTENQFVLSGDGNLNEAAQNLYHALHLMDDKNLKVIIAEKMPNEGVGKSINDRLTRASHQKKE